jgi:hypothetical protein
VFIEKKKSNQNYFKKYAYVYCYQNQVTGGFIFVVVIFLVVLMLVEVSGIVTTFLEGTLLALSMALSSTSVYYVVIYIYMVIYGFSYGYICFFLKRVHKCVSFSLFMARDYQAFFISLSLSLLSLNFTLC